MRAAANSAPSPLIVKAAAERIYAAWLPHVGEIDARQQAQSFASRFHILIDGPLAPLPATAKIEEQSRCATTA